jgi:hypothetical protein
MNQGRLNNSRWLQSLMIGKAHEVWSSWVWPCGLGGGMWAEMFCLVSSTVKWKWLCGSICLRVKWLELVGLLCLLCSRKFYFTGSFKHTWASTELSRIAK